MENIFSFMTSHLGDVSYTCGHVGDLNGLWKGRDMKRDEFLWNYDGREDHCW